VEWLAAEKIRVHGNTGLNWDSPDNIVHELAQLNQLLAEHPAFFDGAKLARLSPVESPVYALLRTSAEGLDQVLVVVNTDVTQPHSLALPLVDPNGKLDLLEVDLLGQPLTGLSRTDDHLVFNLAPGASYCLAAAAIPAGLSGEAYRRRLGHHGAAKSPPGGGD